MDWHLLLTLIICYSACGVIFSKHPIYSVCFYILLFINVSIFFIVHNVEFIGLIYLLVYVGAIAVLFLFIVMMLNIKTEDDDYRFHLWIGFVSFFILSIHITYLLYSIVVVEPTVSIIFEISVLEFINTETIPDVFNIKTLIKNIGSSLFKEEPLLLFFSGVLLLVTLVGTISLTNYKKGYTAKTQYNQSLRKNNTHNTHIH